MVSLSFRERKASGEKIAMLTAYDYPMARLLDETGVDVVLVGDSLGMVVLGYPDTTSVTMEEMEHHVRAAARAKPHGLLAADLPYHSYQTAETALANARRLVKAGAEAVKAEGGRVVGTKTACRRRFRANNFFLTTQCTLPVFHAHARSHRLRFKLPRVLLCVCIEDGLPNVKRVNYAGQAVCVGIGGTSTVVWNT